MLYHDLCYTQDKSAVYNKSLVSTDLDVSLTKLLNDHFLHRLI